MTGAMWRHEWFSLVIALKICIISRSAKRAIKGVFIPLYVSLITWKWKSNYFYSILEVFHKVLWKIKLNQEKKAVSRLHKTLRLFKTPDYVWQEWNSDEGIFCLCYGDWWSTFLDGCMEISTGTYCTDTFMINWLEGRVIVVYRCR